MFVNAYRAGIPVIPHDTNPQGLDNGCAALLIGTAGALALKMFNGATITIPGIPAGMYTINALRVLASGTTATNITAFFD